MRTFSGAFGGQGEKPEAEIICSAERWHGGREGGTEGGRLKNGKKKACAIRRHHLQENRKCVALSLDNDGGKKEAHGDKYDVEVCP